MSKKTALPAVQEESATDEQLPDYLQNVVYRPGLDMQAEDLKIPRIKLIQGLSPEVQDFPGQALPGNFWDTALQRSLGKEFHCVICLGKRRVMLWGPRGGTGTGLLAMSRDGIHWDKPNQSFEVELKGIGKVVYNTRENVQRSGLTKWGTSNPADKNSKPAAQITYEYLIYPLDTDTNMPAVISLYRTGVDVARQLNTALEASRKPATAIKVRVSSKLESNGRDSWYNWRFNLAGVVDKETYLHCTKLAERHSEFEAEIEEPEDISAVTDI